MRAATGASFSILSWLRILFIVLLGAVCLVELSSAQQTLGGITGTVTDPSGAVVSDATVKAVNIATNLEVTAHTKNGSFVDPGSSRRNLSSHRHERWLQNGNPHENPGIR